MCAPGNYRKMIRFQTGPVALSRDANKVLSATVSLLDTEELA